MEKKKVKNKFDLHSEDERINSLLLNLKSKPKIYSRIITSLSLLGKFSKRTDVELFDIISDDENEKILLCCTDEENNMVLFYADSTDRKDWLKITKISNTDEKTYDISLAKKFLLTSENIGYTRTSQEYGFKFGRLITDDYSFYSLFLRDDIGYQIEGNFNENLSEDLLTVLNKFEKIPSLMEYTTIFEQLLAEKNCKFSQLQISAYKDFARVGLINLRDDDNLSNDKKTVLHRTKKQ